MCCFPFSSAFFVFCSDHRPKIKEDNPGISIGDIAKKLGEMWATQSAKDKAPYEAKAARLKEKYEKVPLCFWVVLDGVACIWGGVPNVSPPLPGCCCLQSQGRLWEERRWKEERSRQARRQEGWTGWWWRRRWWRRGGRGWRWRRRGWRLSGFCVWGCEVCDALFSLCLFLGWTRPTV